MESVFPPQPDHTAADELAPTSDVVDRYLAGECSAAERAAVERWQRTGVSQETAVVWLGTMLGARKTQETSVTERADIETRIARIVGRTSIKGNGVIPRREGIAVKEGGLRSRETIFGKHSPRQRYVTVRRAVFPVVTLLGFLLFWFGLRTTSTSRRAIDYVTAPGQHRTVTLVDGTQIHLAPASHLSVDREFNRSTRVIEVWGEALVQVQASTRVPFIVRTGHVTTTVLGTTFAIQARTNGSVNIHVREGRVQVENRRTSVVVAAGGTAQATDSTVALSESVPTQYTDWGRGQLVFNGAPVSDVLETVGQWYGYRFRLADSLLAKQNVSIRFKIADSAEMMVLLRHVLGVDMTFDGTTVTLVRRERRSSPSTPSWHQQFTPSVEMGK